MMCDVSGGGGLSVFVHGRVFVTALRPSFMEGSAMKSLHMSLDATDKKGTKHAEMQKKNT